MIAAQAWLAAVAATWAGHARAESAPLATLVVTRGAGAEDCPTAEGIAGRVAAITGAPIVQTTPLVPTETWVHLELSRDLSRYSAVVQLRGRHQGSRSLSDVSSDCQSLADAVTIALALFFDQHGATPKAPIAAAVRAPTDQPASPRPKSPAYAAYVAGGLGLGLLSAPSPLATAGLDVNPWHGRFRLGLGGGVALPDRVRYADGFTELRLAFGYARGCAEAVRARGDTQLTLCLSPWLGALSGQGYGYDFTDKKRWFWAALVGGAHVQGGLASPSFWMLSANVALPLTLRAFAVSVAGEPHDVFKVPRVGGSLSAGLGVRF